jgi:hypothetical protein
MLRFVARTLVVLTLTASIADAQQTVPPASPTIGASGGVGGGIAIPLGWIADDHAAGYTFAGLVDFSAADQPYSFRTELIWQRYDRKSSAAAGIRDLNMVSLGASVLARSPNSKGSSAFALGGIAIYHVTDLGTRPGVNAGIGLEVPLTFFVGIADVRVHYVLTESRPAITIPITLGARF